MSVLFKHMSISAGVSVHKSDISTQVNHQVDVFSLYNYYNHVTSTIILCFQLWKIRKDASRVVFRYVTIIVADVIVKCRCVCV